MARRRFLDQSFTVGFKGPQDFLTEVDGETEAFIAERLLEIFPPTGSSAKRARPARQARAARYGSSIRSTAPRTSLAACRIFACRSPASPPTRSRSASFTIRCATNCSQAGAAAARGSTARRCARRPRAISPVPRSRSAGTLRAGPEQFVDLLRRVASTGASPSRTGSGALALAYVAAGRRDGFVEHHIHAWDCLAGILLVTEAGGYVNDFLRGDGLTNGNPLVACALGVKDALIAAAAFEGVTI